MDSAGHRVPVVRERDDGDRDGPRATAQPGRVVGVELGSEGPAPVSVEHLPGHDQVDGGVTYGQSSEVEYGGEPVVLDEEVLREEVPVEPAGVRDAGEGGCLSSQAFGSVQV